MIWPTTDGAAIIIANHTSLLDGPALALMTPRPILFGVTPAYSKHPIWRPLMLSFAGLIGTGCRMVPMEPGSVQGMRSLIRELESGGWVCLFPEGGICTGQRYPGVDWLSRRTQAPIHELHIEAKGFGKLRWPFTVTALPRD